MIEWSMEGFSLKSSFVVLIPLHSVKPACRERDIVGTTSVQCMCMRFMRFVPACIVRPSGFFRAITCTFTHGFQTNLAQLFTLTRKSVI